jgi:hypothetical protein
VETSCVPVPLTRQTDLERIGNGGRLTVWGSRNKRIVIEIPPEQFREVSECIDSLRTELRVSRFERRNGDSRSFQSMKRGRLRWYSCGPCGAWAGPHEYERSLRIRRCRSPLRNGPLPGGWYSCLRLKRAGRSIGRRAQAHPPGRITIVRVESGRGRRPGFVHGRMPLRLRAGVQNREFKTGTQLVLWKLAASPYHSRWGKKRGQPPI